MKKFLDDLKAALKKSKVNHKEIEEILADYEEMIKAGMEDGYTEEEIIERFGDPITLAETLAEDEPRSNSKTISEDEYTLWKSFNPESLPLEIESKLVTEDLIIRIGDTSTINILAKGKGEIDRYTLIYEAGKLRLKAPKMVNFLPFVNTRKSCDFIIEVPTSIKVGTVSLSSVNGGLTLSELTIEKCKLSTINGDVLIEQITCETLEWNTVNGDIEANDFKATTLKSSQVSGDVKMARIDIKESVAMDTVSGDVTIHEGVTDRCDLSSVSGDVNAKEFYPNKISLSSVSGDMIIKNDKSHDIQIIKQKSLSGKIKIKQ